MVQESHWWSFFPSELSFLNKNRAISRNSNHYSKCITSKYIVYKYSIRVTARVAERQIDRRKLGNIRKRSKLGAERGYYPVFFP